MAGCVACTGGECATQPERCASKVAFSDPASCVTPPPAVNCPGHRTCGACLDAGGCQLCNGMCVSSSEVCNGDVVGSCGDCENFPMNITSVEKCKDCIDAGCALSFDLRQCVPIDFEDQEENDLILMRTDCLRLSSPPPPPSTLSTSSSSTTPSTSTSIHTSRVINTEDASVAATPADNALSSNAALTTNAIVLIIVGAAVFLFLVALVVGVCMWKSSRQNESQNDTPMTLSSATPSVTPSANNSDYGHAPPVALYGDSSFSNLE